MAALSFTSCQKEESTTNNQKFIPSFEQAGNDKFNVDSDLQMYWDDSYYNNMVPVYAPGFTSSLGSKFTSHVPSSISDDGKTAILEYFDYGGFNPFPANQQGPFYAVSDAIDWSYSHINTDGSFHAGGIYDHESFMPMVARADNYGALQFKHLMGMLNVYVSVPEEYSIVTNVYLNTIGYAIDPTLLNSCDVNWDANGDITLSNIENYITSEYYPLRSGNGFYFVPVCPGDWGDLKFEVYVIDDNQRQHRFAKTMADGASNHVERAGITTLTLNMTMNDMDY